MKMWTVLANDGINAELKSGKETQRVTRPTLMSEGEFFTWLRQDSEIEEEVLMALLNRKAE